MPDTRSHRGPHPEDARLFAPEEIPTLRRAVADLNWMLSRGYSATAARKLVGDRYQLAARQRTAVARCACSDREKERRLAACVDWVGLAGKPLELDGYNVLTTVEAAMAGGIILAACDGTFRDMASMHGSFRRVVETRPALECIGHAVAALGVSICRWYLDRPVCNSARLKAVIEGVARRHGWKWSVDLAANPDNVLMASPEIVATADSAILDRCTAWCNLARETIQRFIPNARIVDLAPSGGP